MRQNASASAVIAAWDALDGLARELRRKLANEQVTLDVLSRELQSYYERATGAFAAASERAKPCKPLNSGWTASTEPASVAEAAQPDHRMSCAPHGGDDFIERLLNLLPQRSGAHLSRAADGRIEAG